MKRRATSTVSSSRKTGSGVLELARAYYNMQHGSEFVIEVDESNFTCWHVGIPAATLTLPSLKRDLATWASKARQPAVVQLEIQFSEDFPSSVPYVRVVRPRFKWRTGHVTIGGSFCTELLTNQGWHEMTVDGLLRTIIVMLHDGGAQIQLAPDEHCLFPLVDYSPEEASVAYQRAKTVHGWK